MARAYTIRYGVVPSSLISDRVLVANPAYGDPIGKWGSRPVTPGGHKLRLLGDFYSKLEESILREGFRNPIFCNCYEEGTFSRYGTSRLWLAKKHNLDIPCVIADHVGTWVELEELNKKTEIEAKFKDIPEIIHLGWKDMRIDGCAHTHLLDRT